MPRDQFDALWEVKKHSPVKIEADQSVRSAADAQLLIKNRMIDALTRVYRKSAASAKSERSLNSAR